LVGREWGDDLKSTVKGAVAPSERTREVKSDVNTEVKSDMNNLPGLRRSCLFVTC
jgi:hypothetical protein